MKCILSKSMLIAIALLILFSAGCAKRAIPDTIAEVEQTWFSFREGEITYDELKEKIADYYLDFDQKYGDEVFVQWNNKDDQGTVPYKDLEGMSLSEIAALREKPDIEMEFVSSQVSVSKPMDADTIDKVQIVLAMSDSDRSDSKIIVDETEVKQLVNTFNTATLGKKVSNRDVIIGGSSCYLFYSGDTLVQKFTFNSNIPERIFKDDTLYYVEYQDKTPYELYTESPAEVITVDADLNEIE